MNDTRSAKGAEASIFKSNRSQAVRIPKALAFPDDVKKVRIVRRDGGLFIKPVAFTWDDYFARGTRLSDDVSPDIEDWPPEDVEPFPG